MFGFFLFKFFLFDLFSKNILCTLFTCLISFFGFLAFWLLLLCILVFCFVHCLGCCLSVVFYVFGVSSHPGLERIRFLLLCRLPPIFLETGVYEVLVVLFDGDSAFLDGVLS